MLSAVARRFALETVFLRIDTLGLTCKTVAGFLS